MNHTPKSLEQRKTNAQKMYKRRRDANTCHRGHTNDWGINPKNGRRFCRPCKVERNRQWRKRNKSNISLSLVTPVVSARIEPLTFEERRVLKQKISEIQTAREAKVRRMWIEAPNGNRVYLGGDTRPIEEQCRTGYPLCQTG